MRYPDCGDGPPILAAPETTTTVRVTSTEPAPATTTLAVGPQPLPAGGFLEPGEYQTTVFQPTVVYKIDRKHILDPFQDQLATGFQSK